MTGSFNVIRADMVLSSEDQEELMVLLDRLNEFIEEEVGRRQGDSPDGFRHLKTLRQTSERMMIRIKRNPSVLMGAASKNDRNYQ